MSVAKSKKPKVAGDKAAKPAKKPAAKPAKAAKKPAVKPKVVKKPATKPAKVAATRQLMMGGDRAIAEPNITSPADGSQHPPGQGLPINADINIDTVRYRITITQLGPRAPAPTSIDVTPVPPATSITATLPGVKLLPDKSYMIQVVVHPDDTIPGDLGSSVTITTAP